MSQKSILVIGAGISGLCTGIYARLNGYRTTLVEMHALPGGVCTAWKRHGYTIDGCVHWMVGSGPGITLNRYWQEVGALEGRQFVYQEELVTCQGVDGRVFHFYCNPDRLEKHMLELSPRDAPAIKDLIDGLRFCQNFNPPEKATYEMNFLDNLKLGLTMLPKLPTMQRFMKITIGQLADRFTDPLIATALRELWFPEMTAFYMLMTVAWVDRKLAGYPIGGSLPLALSLEKNFKSLGGQVQYNARVSKILVENNSAVGVRLEDGRELRADIVVSAADGHTTIFDMLEGKYIDDTIRGYYRDYPLYPPLVFVGLGVNRAFNDETSSIMGNIFPLKAPVSLAGSMHSNLYVHVYNFDPTLAPPGKTTLVVAIPTRYEFWKALGEQPDAYHAEKERIAAAVVALLEQRWPGISTQVEMCDVATPLTFIRYTGNWQASYEGFLATPQNAMVTMRKTLPGLENFYMAGQWVVPGGGLPTGVMCGRETVFTICKKDKKVFRTTPS